MEVNVQPVVSDRRSDVEAPERPSQSTGAQEAASTTAIHNIDARVDHEGKKKKKVEEKKKEPVFIRGVELINLDDCDVLNMRLHYDAMTLVMTTFSIQWVWMLEMALLLVYKLWTRIWVRQRSCYHLK
jgi:hypothetical protein